MPYSALARPNPLTISHKLVNNVDLSDGGGFDPIQNVSKVMDFYSVNSNLASCVMGAMQDAGISYESGLDALPEPAGIDSQ
jgi:hypothetical protein